MNAILLQLGDILRVAVDDTNTIIELRLTQDKQSVIIITAPLVYLDKISYKDTLVTDQNITELQSVLTALDINFRYLKNL